MILILITATRIFIVVVPDPMTCQIMAASVAHMGRAFCGGLGVAL
jgi:threonine/homoserine/homoserine lactone efflux protein